MPRFLKQIIILLTGVTFLAADPIEIEAIKCIATASGRGARIVGVARNTSDHLIILPTLEVTYVTKQQPEEAQLQRLSLSLYLRPGQSQPFHSGEFFANSSETIQEMKSWRILPGTTVAPSSDWNHRLDSRGRITVSNIQFTLEKGEHGATSFVWVRGNLNAPKDSRFADIFLIAACFDTKGHLLEVGTIPIRSRDGTPLDTFPHGFTGGLGTALKGNPATVKVFVAYFSGSLSEP